MQTNAFRDLAGGDQLPQRDQQLAGERHDHGLPGGAAAVLGTLAEPLDQRAVGLVAQKAPGELDQRPPHAGITGLGQPFLAPLAAALVGRAGGAGVSCHRPAIPQMACQGLAHQQFGGAQAQA